MDKQLQSKVDEAIRLFVQIEGLQNELSKIHVELLKSINQFAYGETVKPIQPKATVHLLRVK